MFGQYSYNSFQPQQRERAAYARNADNSTGARVKRVFSVEQTIHVWAQRSQTNGENSKGNLYFVGDRLFDYGDHFCLGQFVTNKRGALCCLLNADTFSVTTTYHQGVTARAIPAGIPTFTVPKAGYDRYSRDSLDLDDTIKSYCERASDFAAKGKRARKEYAKDWNIAKAHGLLTEAQEFAAFFSIKFKAANLEDMAAEAEAARKRVLAKERRDAANARKLSKERFEQWQRGEISHCPTEWQLDECGGVRVRIIDMVLQTARGAEVPLFHAIRAFRFLKRCRARGETWQRNGHSLRVGHFTIDHVNTDGSFTAGCHTFSWPTIEAAAKVAGVADIAPANTTQKTEAA